MARRRKGQSQEDQDIWNRVAQTATPLHPVKAAGLAPPSAQPAQPPKPLDRTPFEPFRLGEAASSALTAHRVAPSVREEVDQAPVRMHDRTHRKMVRGKLTPEARIDLHGLTLDRAQPRLTQFILGAKAQGLRLVLVITGKGRDRDDGGPIPARRGVLRHQVPAWLRSPPLSAAVLDIRTAHFRHGGEGAYYVYLSKQR